MTEPLPPCVERCCLVCGDLDPATHCMVKRRMKCTAIFADVPTPLPDAVWEANGTSNEWSFFSATIADIIPIEGSPGASVPLHIDCVDDAEMFCEEINSNPFAFPVHPAASLGCYRSNGLFIILTPQSINTVEYPACDNPGRGHFRIRYYMGTMASQGFTWADGDIFLEFETID